MSVSIPGSTPAFPLMSAGASNKGPTSLRSSPTPERAIQKPTSTIPMYPTEIMGISEFFPLLLTEVQRKCVT